MKKSIGILGAGTWGSALAHVLAGCGHDVTIWSALQDEIDNLSKTRIHPKLPGMILSQEIKLTGSLEEVCSGKDVVLFAVPSIFVRNTAAAAAKFIGPRQVVVDVAKGIEHDSLKTMSEIIGEELGFALGHSRVVALTGPTHAEEVALDRPTAIIAACGNAASAGMVKDLFNDSCMMVYISSDTRGVELCGAFKNIIALAAGISDGLGHGDNAKAALMTLGMGEIARLGIAMGCRERTFYGLAGIGDLIVTATSVHSRNNSCGKIIGGGVPVQEAVKKIGTVEGIYALPAAMRLAEIYRVKIPLISAVNDVITQAAPPSVIISALKG